MEITPAEFNSLTSTNNEFLMAYATKLTGNIDDAKDLYQETVIKIITRPNRFDGNNFKAWSARVMYRKFLDHIRKPNNKQIYTDIEEDHISYELRYEEMSDEMLNAINRTPVHQVKALTLLSVYGYTHNEAAKIMNRSPQMINTWNHRAKQNMKKHLKV